MKKVAIGLLFLMSQAAMAQAEGQLIRGTVKDKVTGTPVTSAHVEVDGFTAGVITDELGVFRLEGIPFGRQTLRITHASYETIEIEVLVTSSKESVLSVEMDLTTVVLDEVAIQNQAFILSGRGIGTRSINMEQTNRIPANFFDPVRMATSFPGVAASNDQANNIVVRGNSPNSVAWRLEGLTIVNPNHTANAGTFSDLPTQAGGGVNILSGQMLGSSRFIASPMDADLGNGFSAFDLRFRNGNDENWEFTAQASLVGMDIAAEGPIAGGSLLANYRYSTVGILTGPLGLDFGGEVINFQDLSFSYNKPISNNTELTVFGVGGISINEFTPSLNSADWEVDKDSQFINYSGATGIVGAKIKHSLSERSQLNMSMALSSTEQKRGFVEKDNNVIAGSNLAKQQYEINRNIVSININHRSRLNRGFLEIGGMFDQHGFDLRRESFFDLNQAPIILENSMMGWNIQPYIMYKTELAKRVLLESGVRASIFTANTSSNIEPRVALSTFLADQSNFRLSYSRLSHMPSIQAYLMNAENKSLELEKADILSLSYERPFLTHKKIQVETYYQMISDAPMNLNTGFTTLNGLDEYSTDEFMSIGQGRNYGVELSLEKEMENNSYYFGGLSLYQSQYLLDDTWSQSRYNTGYTVNITYGRENVSEKKGNIRVLNYSARLLYLGGFNAPEIDEDASRNGLRTVFLYGRGYTETLDDYFRIDFSISWRKNRPKSSRVIGIDIQNVLGRENESLMYFDVRKDEVVSKMQLGMIPILYYKIEF